MGAVELALAYLETTLRNKRPRVLQGYMLSSKENIYLNLLLVELKTDINNFFWSECFSKSV